MNAVLVVDDEMDIRESLRDILELHFPGVQVLLAADGKEALHLLAKNPVDLIISDYRMPRMDGLTFLAEARKKVPGAPRVLITAYPELDVAVRAINDAAISNFLTKPLNANQLLEVVRAALVKARVHATA